MARRRGGRPLDARALASALVTAALVCMAPGCGADSTDRPEPRSSSTACSERPVRSGVAASLREVALALADDLEAAPAPVRIETSFGASSALARQLELGAPLDLLVMADATIAARLVERSLVEPSSQREIAGGRLVLVAPPGSAFEARGLSALRSPALRRIAVPPAAVPLGRYARAWLARESLRDALEGRIVETEHARATLSAVVHGHVDLAIVYESDRRRAPELEVVHRPGSDRYPEIRYVAARSVRASSCPEVGRALAAWGSERTRRRLAHAGFELPEAVDAGSVAGGEARDAGA